MDTDHPDFPQHGAFRWKALGYHFQIPSTIHLMDQGGVEASDPWVAFLAVFEQLTNGDFSNTHRVVDCMDTTDDWVLLRAAAEVLGDAGSVGCLKAVLDRFQSETNPDIEIEVCRSLWCSHFLWTVPLMMEMYLNAQNRRESAIIPIQLNKLLSSMNIPYPEEAGPGDEDWRHSIQQRYDELRTRCGNDVIPVFNGELYSVRQIAIDFLNGVKSEDGILEVDFFSYRHKIEAATGIDCRPMFHEDRPQPLATAAILETFLDSLEADKYEPGVRYFFGHRIPD